MQRKHHLTGLICSLVFVHGCSSDKTENWQRLPGSPEEPASVDTQSIQRDGKMVTMNVRINFTTESPTNKKIGEAGKPLLKEVNAKYRYDCEARTVELLKAVEQFLPVGGKFGPDPVETEFPPNAAPVQPNSSAEDAFNIACKAG
ncbi:MAG: surface-adhesin E family protein [Arenimonas sp.]